MVNGGQFAALVAELKEGSQEAAWDLVELYGPYILRVVRRSLNRKIRSKFDSQDFVQAVWASFFTHRDRFLHVDKPEQLVGLLAAMARHKIVDEMRRRLDTEKHDVRRERSMDDWNVVIPDTLASGDPTPSQVAMARERWNRMMEGQPELHRQIVRLRLAGETHQAIARQLGVNKKTVQRVLQRLLNENTSHKFLGQ
jgi:RNA polymerase sigma factor (sigma-70 family)